MYAFESNTGSITEDGSLLTTLIPRLNFTTPTAEDDYDDPDLSQKSEKGIKSISRAANRKRTLTQNFTTDSFSAFDTTNPAEGKAILESLMNKDEYNPFKIPASIDLAKKHWESTGLGIPFNQLPPGYKLEPCPCCHRVKVPKVSLCQNPVTFQGLGSTIPLYFQFTNYLIGLTMFMFLAFFYPGLQQAQRFVLYNQMEKGVDLSFWDVKVFYMYDKGFYGWNCAGAAEGRFPGCTLEYLLDCYHRNIYLSSLVIALMHFFCVLAKFYQMELIQKSELCKHFCAKTYTVMLDQVHDDQSEEEIESEIQKMVEEAEMKKSIKIVKIIKGSMVGYMNVLKSQIEDETKELEHIRDTIVSSGLQTSDQYKKFYKMTKKELEGKKKKLKSMKGQPILLKMAKTRGVAFITVETHSDKGRLVRAYHKLKKKGCWCCFRHKIRHNVLDPPEPNDIRWHTIGYSEYHKFGQSLLSNLVFVLLIPFFVAMDMCLRVFLYMVQNWLDKKHQNLLEAFFYGYSLIIILYGMVRVFGMLADKIFNYLNDSQKMLTVNGLYTSHTIKNAFFKLFLYIGAAVSSVGLSLDESEAEQSKILPFFSSIFMFMVVRIFIEPAMDLFNPGYLAKRQRQARIEEMHQNGSYLEDKKLAYMTQEELNEIFKRPDPKIQDRYSKALIVVLTQAFFLPFIPFIAIFACISLFTSNLATRYVFYRRTTRPLYRTGLFSGALLTFTMLIPSFLNLFNIMVFVVYSVLNWQKIDYLEFSFKIVILSVNTYPIGFLFKICIERYFEGRRVKKNLEDIKFGVAGNGMSYLKNSHLMFHDYDRLNPMTKKGAKDEWIVQKNLKNSLHALDRRSKRFGLGSEVEVEGVEGPEGVGVGGGGEDAKERVASFMTAPTDFEFVESEEFEVGDSDEDDGFGDDPTEAAT